ncbi:thioredoxin [Absidia repens]|uniref:Thioredoxin n=1 Tax=Absidia repens TaxID=90262 RepID=A0A1X2IK34_9FUNG|nr:thioredoxin [Absidia repens]
MPIENYPKNLAEFNTLIASDKLVVVDFHATWCGPCKLIGPKFEKLVEEYPGVVFAKVDVDDVPDVAAEVGVRAMPTFMFFKNGSKVGEVVGASLPNIVNKIKELSA